MDNRGSGQNSIVDNGGSRQLSSGQWGKTRGFGVDNRGSAISGNRC